MCRASFFTISATATPSRPGRGSRRHDPDLADLAERRQLPDHSSSFRTPSHLRNSACGQAPLRVVYASCLVDEHRVAGGAYDPAAKYRPAGRYPPRRAASYQSRSPGASPINSTAPGATRAGSAASTPSRISRQGRANPGAGAAPSNRMPCRSAIASASRSASCGGWARSARRQARISAEPSRAVLRQLILCPDHPQGIGREQKRDDVPPGGRPHTGVGPVVEPDLPRPLHPAADHLQRQVRQELGPRHRPAMPPPAHAVVHRRPAVVSDPRPVHAAAYSASRAT